MYNTHHSLYSYLTSMPIFRVLISILCVTLLFTTQASHALAPNPGAVCDSNFAQGSLTSSDYTNLVNSNDYVNIAGDSSGAIPLQIKMTISEKNGPPTRGSFAVATVGNDSAFQLFRNFPSVDSVTSVDLEFRNRVTERPIFLTNVALSAFDIDYALNNRNAFDDYVLFSGVTASGDTINGSYQSLQAAGSNIRPFPDTRPNTPGLGLYTLNTNTATECPGTNLDVDCQGSVQFSEPVSSVKIRYSNANYRTSYRNPTNQQIFFRVDNYCYVPQYIFSGIVFNDAGGIIDAEADANKDNLTTGVYANRPNYFNGVFNPPQESGISGSTVRLANCANTGTTYPTQSVLKTGAPTGAYQISIPKTTLGSNTNLCLVESRTGNTYPIRTTSDSRNIGFSATTYNYPNNNFGRVVAANRALVLKKSQYINDCPATLNYASINDAPTPLTGFSTAMIEGIAPGRCIAYKITATNRANIKIDNFIMKDVLQKKGTGGALVTSVLANPALATADYITGGGANSSPAIGENGTVRTKNLVLEPRSKRNFYFNTKYGTSQ
ncbi:hypothetical protein [uncultured Psychrobacter sp.]|uniref:hypothetical protein n=1 Tax=uncultured Psychrobacter sp. TaxID=259303 RepID=UPI00261B814C|nr:hypothetical protein [uncultured Psychrobacter sp.]